MVHDRPAGRRLVRLAEDGRVPDPDDHLGVAALAADRRVRATTAQSSTTTCTTKKKAYSGRSVKAAIKEIVEAALPDQAFSIHAEDDADTVEVEAHTIADAAVPGGRPRSQIAQARGFEVFFDYNGNLVIRATSPNDDNGDRPGRRPRHRNRVATRSR